MKKDQIIIALEGGEAAGKFTHSKNIAFELKGTRFGSPDYSTATGEAILENLQKKWAPLYSTCTDEVTKARTERLNHLVFQSLMTANRLEQVPHIMKALQDGPVIFDRWTESMRVYGAVEGLDAAWLHAMAATLPQPDLQILIDLPVEESFRRRPERRDRNETNRPFLEKVRAEYLIRWKGRIPGDEKSAAFANDNWKSGPRYRIVDGSGTVEEVHGRICAVIKASFPGRDFPW